MSEPNLIPKYQIVSLEKGNDWERFNVTVNLPMKYGWFERVSMHILNSNFDALGQPNRFQHKENDENYAIFEIEITLSTSALYYFYFSYEVNGCYTVFKKSNTGNSITKSECFKISVHFTTPEWAKGAVMYQIFPDRFYRDLKFKIPEMSERTVIEDWYKKVPLGPNKNGEWNTEFYGGNLLGIIDKLDYIKSLSVSIIYLNPICWGQSNHLYDTIDYTKVDPFLGNTNHLKKLCEESHKRGIHIVLDGVFNHTGNRSVYFDQYEEHSNNGAYNNTESPYKNFYRQTWHNGQKYYNFWWGHTNLPECDTTAEEWLSYITGEGGVIDQWFSYGIDGIRLDVADELSDLMIEKILTAIIRNKPDGFLYGEVWENPMRKNRGFLSSGKGMHSVMNYYLADSLVRYYKYQDLQKLGTIINEIFTEYPEETINTLMNFTSTHDMSRAIELFSSNVFNPRKKDAWDLDCENASDFVKNHTLSIEEYEYGKSILKSYCTALAFFPGIFSIFYGDEVGLQGLHNLANRAPYPWGKEDKDLLEFFRKMLRVKTEQQLLKNAECQVLEISKDRFMYERISSNEKILVVASRTHHERKTNIPDEYNDADIIFKVNESTTKNYMPPYGALVLKK